ncbi:MAG TPA: Glu/Leu/Phe/Val dehydrogenase dimerization domain-containing protein, partial [Nitrospiria bacterium]|nr:Glu/Leu/Phe/Val dehydrogenase dimerization domain-containing protein [Nitrospiria bacterium]
MADLFRRMENEGHEQLLISNDRETGMNAIISIHSTVLGPALGGCRVWPYRNFDAAVVDALRLSRAMTYKAAVHGLNLGGGKAVLSLPPGKKTPEILRAFGRMVDSLAGLYFTAEDVGMSEEDLGIVREVTRYATGISVEAGGGGDPSPWTALGVLSGMRACLGELDQTDSFQGKVVAIQ